MPANQRDFAPLPERFFATMKKIPAISRKPAICREDPEIAPPRRGER
jgi:hypothetical protein